MDTIVSLDLLEEYFACDLDTCKGICCVQGDAGAPVEEKEIALLEAAVPLVWNDLSTKAKHVLGRQGVVYMDQENEFVTSIIENDECVFACYNQEQCCKCSIENVFLQGKIRFRKPISCQLYPVRVTQYQGMRAVNYHRWDICRSAIKFGKKRNIKLYQFLKDPLIRKFGEQWYECLCQAAGELNALKKSK